MLGKIEDLKQKNQKEKQVVIYIIFFYMEIQ